MGGGRGRGEGEGVDVCGNGGYQSLDSTSWITLSWVAGWLQDGCRMYAELATVFTSYR